MHIFSTTNNFQINHNTRLELPMFLIQNQLRFLPKTAPTLYQNGFKSTSTFCPIKNK